MLPRLSVSYVDDEQSAWHAGLDAGREQGRGKDHTHQPPSAPVGVERKYPDDGNGDDDAYNRGWNDCLDALAQQPAAVDVTYPTPRNRAEALALARLALAYLGVIDSHISAAITRCETDSGTKPGGSDNDR